MAGFTCTSKYHHGDKWVGDPLYRADIFDSGEGTCYDCWCCERWKKLKVRIPPIHKIQASTGVHRVTAWRHRTKAQKMFRGRSTNI